MFSRRVFISVPADNYLGEKRSSLVNAILQSISKAGFEPQRFLYSGLPASMGWNFQTVDEVMRRCVGAVIFAFPRWKALPPDHPSIESPIPLITEYNHYEGAVATTLGLPTLIIAE